MTQAKETVTVTPKIEANVDYTLPTPTFPTMEMPPRPQGVPSEGVIPACDGESYQDMAKLNNSNIPDLIPGVPRILIGLPVLSYSHEFVESFLKFWTQLCTQTIGKMQVGFYFVYRKPVHMAEIVLAEMAIWNKCTHLLLMDDDIYDVTLADLQKLLDADKEVIGGVMYASGFPYAQCVFRRFETEKKVIDMPSDNSMYRLYEVPCICVNPKCNMGLSHWDAKFCPACGTPQDNMIQKADLIPFPFTLIKTSVFSKIKKPWFHCEIEYPTDSWFADRCIEAGIQEYAHMGVRLNHRGINDQSRSFFFQRDLAKKQANKDLGLITVSEEEMARHQFLLNSKMREAEDKLKPQPEMITINKEASNDSKTKIVANDLPKEESSKVSS
jgi:hypothetical protein